MTLSTHVLDTGLGEPAAGIPVRLERAHDGGWLEIGAGTTDADGRLRDWVPEDQWHAGTYRLVFDTESYLGPQAFYPEVVITFRAEGAGQHYHVPLLLSPFAYSTYRGS